MTTSHAAAVPEAQLPPLTDGPHRKRIGLISIVACLGGLLFGYDTGVSNGAEGPMAKELGLSLLQLGVVISSLIFAAAVGALIGGQISDRIGRRKTIIVLAVMFFVGVLFVVFSPGFEILVAGRIILGLAVGGASTVVPVYLAELAPYEIRGSITGRNELAIVLGQFLAFVVNAILGNTLGDHVEGVWRIMFGICALPAVALFVGMPEIDDCSAKRAAASRQYNAGKFKRAAGSATLAQVAALRRTRLEKRSFGLAHCRFVAVVTGRRGCTLLRRESVRTGQFPSGGKRAGAQQKSTACWFRQYVHAAPVGD